jgi:hypothetical protein
MKTNIEKLHVIVDELQTDLDKFSGLEFKTDMIMYTSDNSSELKLSELEFRSTIEQFKKYGGTMLNLVFTTLDNKSLGNYVIFIRKYKSLLRFGLHEQHEGFYIIISDKDGNEVIIEFNLSSESEVIKRIKDKIGKIPIIHELKRK